MFSAVVSHAVNNKHLPTAFIGRTPTARASYVCLGMDVYYVFVASKGRWASGRGNIMSGAGGDNGRGSGAVSGKVGFIVSFA